MVSPAHALMDLHLQIAQQISMIAFQDTVRMTESVLTVSMHSDANVNGDLFLKTVRFVSSTALSISARMVPHVWKKQTPTNVFVSQDSPVITALKVLMNQERQGILLPRNAPSLLSFN